ncbi:hypothetical protein V1522DRAFT_447941 [Lipomyces starkeyi]
MRIHNVFHISLLKPFVPSDLPRRPEPPPPAIEIDSELYYQVDEIVNSRRSKKDLGTTQPFDVMHRLRQRISPPISPEAPTAKPELLLADESLRRGKYPRWTWSGHLQHVLILCQTHVKRAFRKKFPDHEATSAIDLIWSVNSKAEVLQIMDEVVEKWPETKAWFRHKKSDWILAGITSEASKIPIEWWTNAPHHTGISESSHFHDNEAVGRKQALLTAILRCKTHTREMEKKNEFAVQEGIYSTWRSQNPISRIAKQYRKKDKRHRSSANRRIQRSYLPWNPNNPYDALHPTMQPPSLQSIDDSISVASSEVSGITSEYSPAIPRAQSSTPRLRGHSVLTESPGLAPQDSISQQIPVNQDLANEEAQLLREIAELEHKQRIQALRKKREELIRREQEN